MLRDGPLSNNGFQVSQVERHTQEASHSVDRFEEPQLIPPLFEPEPFIKISVIIGTTEATKNPWKSLGPFLDTEWILLKFFG
jgi:hypothetical protein